MESGAHVKSNNRCVVWYARVTVRVCVLLLACACSQNGEEDENDSRTQDEPENPVTTAYRERFSTGDNAGVEQLLDREGDENVSPWVEAILESDATSYPGETHDVRLIGWANDVAEGLFHVVLRRLVDPDHPAIVGALKPLVDALIHGDRDTKLRAAVALQTVGRARHSETVPALAKVLKDEDPQLRWAAATALEWYGRVAASARPALEECLSDSEVEVRFIAASALFALGEPGPSLQSVLEEITEDDTLSEAFRLRAGAILALLREGSRASSGWADPVSSGEGPGGWSGRFLGRAMPGVGPARHHVTPVAMLLALRPDGTFSCWERAATLFMDPERVTELRWSGTWSIQHPWLRLDITAERSKELRVPRPVALGMPDRDRLRWCSITFFRLRGRPR